LYRLAKTAVYLCTIALILSDGNEDGKFMVRLRSGSQTDFVLTVVYRGKPTHHLVLLGGDGLYTINRKAYGQHNAIDQVSHTSQYKILSKTGSQTTGLANQYRLSQRWHSKWKDGLLF
jgi:hypothetical protein